MNTNTLLTCVTVFLLSLSGCAGDDADPPKANKDSKPADKEPKKAEGKRELKKLEKGIYLESQGDVKRVVFDATVCWGADRKGFELFEHLVCKSKEHESILNTTVNVQLVHAALVAIKAEPGHPSQYKDKKFVAPEGTPIKVTLRYKEKDKEKEVPGQSLIRYVKTKKDLDLDWIFGGSVLINDVMEEGKKVYLANSGNVICVCSMGDAMMELPIDNPQGPNNLFEPVLDRIPPMGTEVQVVLEPILKKK